MSEELKDQYDKIYRYCYLRVHSRELAEDLTQETFLRYLEHPHYRSVSKSLQLLYTIAGNLCADHFRKPPEEDIENLAESAESPESGEKMEKEVLARISLQRALASLEPEEREIVLLRCVNEVPLNVVSSLYGCSRFTMRRRIQGILAALRRELEKEEPE